MDDLLGAVAVVVLVGVVLFVLFVVLIVWAVCKAIDAFRNRGKAPEYVHVDIDGDISEEQVADILRKYRMRYGVADFARAGLSALESASHKRDSFYAALDAKFKPGTISWDRYAVGADSALKAIVRNCGRLANDIQAFDSDDYKRLRRLFEGGVASGQTADAVQQERWGMYQGRLQGLQEVVAGNEKMLLELDRLEAELGKLENAERTEESDSILAEIRTLTEEMKYYK